MGWRGTAYVGDWKHGNRMASNMGMTPPGGEKVAMRRVWVGDGRDWVLLPVAKPEQPDKLAKAKTILARGHQIFTAWAFAGHNHGTPVVPKRVGFGTTDAEEIEADVATAEAALLAFAKHEPPRVVTETRAALTAHHLDGKTLYGADVLNAERCYRLAVRIERGHK